MHVCSNPISVYVFACLFYSAGLSVSVLDWSSNDMPAVWLHLKCFVLCLFTCFNYSQKPGIKTDSTIEQMNSFTCLSIFSSPELTRVIECTTREAGLVFKGSLLGFVKERLIEYG